MVETGKVRELDAASSVSELMDIRIPLARHMLRNWRTAPQLWDRVQAGRVEIAPDPPRRPSPRPRTGREWPWDGRRWINTELPGSY